MKAANIKRFFTKNWKDIIFYTLIFFVFLVPSGRAALMQGLMHFGLFKPDVSVVQEPSIKLTEASQNDLPKVELVDSKNFSVYLPKQAGKVVLINFWATWCPPCLAEMPSLNKLYTRFKGNSDVIFLFVDADADFEKSMAYMRKKGYTMPVYKQLGNFPSELFSGALPTTLVFNKAGKLVYKGEGAANYADKKFIQFMDELLAEKGN